MGTLPSCFARLLACVFICRAARRVPLLYHGRFSYAFPSLQPFGDDKRTPDRGPHWTPRPRIASPPGLSRTIARQPRDNSPSHTTCHIRPTPLTRITSATAANRQQRDAPAARCPLGVT